MSVKKKFTNRKFEQDKPFTLHDAKELVLRVKKSENRATKTISAYEQVFNDFDKFFGNDTDVRSLMISDANNYIYWQLHEKEPYSNSSRRDRKDEKGVSARTTNNYLVIAKSIFNILERHGITNNIFNDIKKLREDEKVTKTLSIDEINKLFKEYDKRLYVEFRNFIVCHVMFDCFSRISETLSLKKSDVDFDNKTIIFNKTKSKKFRIVPASDETLKLLKELIKENEVFNSDYIFLTINGNQLDSDTFRKNLYVVAGRAEIKTNVYPHIFRHTASKMFIQEGGNIRVLQKILGHASVETTEKYAHVLAETVTHYHESFSPIKKLKKESKTRTSRKRK